MAELLSGNGSVIDREQCPAASRRSAECTATVGCANCSYGFESACCGCDISHVRVCSGVSADYGFNGEHDYDAGSTEHATWDGRDCSTADVCNTYARYSKSNG